MKIKAQNALLNYYPSFFDTQVARTLTKSLLSEVAFSQDTITLYGKQHNVPRLQAWFGSAGYQYSGLLMKPLSWTPSLLAIKEKVEHFSGYQFNSALVNLYRNQHDSVSWHSDDEPELGKHPVIASISLGATRTFKLKHKESKENLTIPLVEGSLLMMEGETQEYWQHAVLKEKKVSGPRINITFRQLHK